MTEKIIETLEKRAADAEKQITFLKEKLDELELNQSKYYR